MTTVIDKSRVLIVDDEPQIAGASWTMLSRQGYQVRVVCTSVKVTFK